MDKIRVSAKNYDEAVTKALLELQTSSENVKVDVIEKGTGGFLGILGGTLSFSTQIGRASCRERV